MFLDGLSLRNKMNCQGMIHYHFCEKTFGIAFLCRETQINNRTRYLQPHIGFTTESFCTGVIE